MTTDLPITTQPSAMSEPPTTDRTARRVRPSRSEGQWALGEREPLTPNEEWKAREDGLAVRERVAGYARGGFASIPAEDRNGRLRWWGLYTQRRPGVDGGRTAAMAPEELDDEFFMLRVRLDGGAVDLDQLRALAEVSYRYARGTADVTDRGNLQFHWIRIEDVPAVWDTLETAGLLTLQTCGDTPRTVLGSPVAGVAADELVDGTPAVREITERYLGQPELANLPRKFKTAISGSPRQDVAHELQDLAFVGVVHPVHGPGFDVWVGGGLSTAPMTARRLGAWVPLEEVAEVWYGVIRLFRDYGYRRLRSRARLKFLMADWGPERFREVLETEYLGRRLVDGPPPAPRPPGHPDHVGVHRQRDRRFAVGTAPLVGRISGAVLEGLVTAMERAGSTRARFTPGQKILVLDVEAERVADLVDDLDALGLPARASAIRRGTMACTGIEFCKLAITESKATAAHLVTELEHRLGDVPELFTPQAPPISIHLNGCPNTCARSQVADIGLKGVRVADPASPDGPTVDGYQVHLGGRLDGTDTRFGRTIRGLRIPGSGLPDYLERLIRRWLTDRAGDETFTAWVERASEDDLR